MLYLNDLQYNTQNSNPFLWLRSEEEDPSSSKESQRVPTSPNESRRVPTNPNESQRVPTNESQRVPTSPNESQELTICFLVWEWSMLILDSPKRIPKSSKEFQGVPICPNESQRVPKSPNEFQRVPKFPKDNGQLPTSSVYQISKRRYSSQN